MVFNLVYKRPNSSTDTVLERDRQFETDSQTNCID